MKTDMKAMRPDEFAKYVIEHKIILELGAMELVLTAMAKNTEFYRAIGLSAELSATITDLYSARKGIEEIMRKLAVEEGRTSLKAIKKAKKEEEK